MVNASLTNFFSFCALRIDGTSLSGSSHGRNNGKQGTGKEKILIGAVIGGIVTVLLLVVVLLLTLVQRRKSSSLDSSIYADEERGHNKSFKSVTSNELRGISFLNSFFSRFSDE